MTRKILIVSVLTLFLFAGCRRESLDVKPEITDAEVALAQERLIKFVKINHVQPLYAAHPEIMQPSSSKRAKTYGLSVNHDYNYFQSLINRSINPDDYECEPTKFSEWIWANTSKWTDNDIMMFNFWGGIIFDYVYIFENKNGGQSYGTEGQYTKATNKTFKDLLDFWDIPTNILMRDCHSENVYSNLQKIIKVLVVYEDLGILPPLTEAEEMDLAKDIKTVFGSKRFKKYKHPMLSLNAFAATADSYFGTPKKIVMGDGIMEVYDELGFEDVAPQAILAHEYGHHVQFANNVDFGFDAEGTRRTELMADALAGYYLTHKSGGNMNWKRVKQFLEVFYLIGDCAFDDINHHGTPNQRMRSAQFGYEVASDTRKKCKKHYGKIIDSEEFITLFDAALSDLVAPDVQ